MSAITCRTVVAGRLALPDLSAQLYTEFPCQRKPFMSDSKRPRRSVRRHSGPVPDAIAAVVRRLAELGTFSAADVDDLTAIAEAGRLVTVPAGWSVIWDGTPADKAYVILDGEVEVRRREDSITLGAGEFVGELAILRHRLRSATVVAVTDLRVLHFEGDALEHLYREVPAVRSALDATIARRTSTDPTPSA